MSISLGSKGIADLAVALPDADPDVDLARIANAVLEHGASRCQVIPSSEVVLREDPAAHAEECRCAPGNLMDPPFAPTPSEFRPWLEGFRSALIIQSDATPGARIFAQGMPGWACELRSLRESGDDYAETHAAWLRLQDAVMWAERELFRSGYYLSVGFGALTCAMCQPCDVTELCKFPYSARPSMEAVGIDVGATLERLDLRGGSGGDGGALLTGLVLAV